MPLDLPGPRLDRIFTFCLNAGKVRVLIVTVLMMAAIAYADWAIGVSVSLGALYILPMMLAAVVLSPRSIVGLALICAILRRILDSSPSEVEVWLRFLFALFAYIIAGLFVTAAVRNRKMAVEHLRAITQEQALRSEAEGQLRTLVESSPAGILTLDANGVVLAANNAVNELFGMAEGHTLKGKQIDSYLPVLADALRLNSGATPFRTSAQSQGWRENGEPFLADTWFSTYGAADGKRLSAIVIDTSDEMRDREEQTLRQLSMNSRIMAGAMLHEVRNLCSAISAVYSNAKERIPGDPGEHLQGLEHLMNGLTRVASLELHSREVESLEAVSLKDVLDDLRIIIEPDWVEAGGVIRWDIADNVQRVLGDRHGLLQVFLNLAQNSLRAVEEWPVRELDIRLCQDAQRTQVRFQDSGPGIPDPHRLFEPFQPAADSSGLGLYIARSILRSYGGELRFEPQETGACFVVQLLQVGQRSSQHA